MPYILSLPHISQHSCPDDCNIPPFSSTTTGFFLVLYFFCQDVLNQPSWPESNILISYATCVYRISFTSNPRKVRARKEIWDPVQSTHFIDEQSEAHVRKLTCPSLSSIGGSRAGTTKEVTHPMYWHLAIAFYSKSPEKFILRESWCLSPPVAQTQHRRLVLTSFSLSLSKCKIMVDSYF